METFYNDLLYLRAELERTQRKPIYLLMGPYEYTELRAHQSSLGAMVMQPGQIGQIAGIPIRVNHSRPPGSVVELHYADNRSSLSV